MSTGAGIAVAGIWVAVALITQTDIMTGGMAAICALITIAIIGITGGFAKQ